MIRPRPVTAAALLVSALLVACGEPATPPADPELVGTWRATLTSPGGELPFTLEIRDGGGRLLAAAVNGREEASFSGVERDGDRVRLAVRWYDSEIDARLVPGGRLEGRWRKTVPKGTADLPFRAVKGDSRRFLPSSSPASGPAPLASVTGTWGAVFTDDDGSQKAVGEFSQEGSRVTGTFLTPTGDYRFLAGDYADGVLRLSTFDGAHVFLFVAHAREDGTLAGDFWSRDNYHATWTARPIEPTETRSELPDPYSLVHLTSRDGRLHFHFDDLDGRPLSLDDPRFHGKVVLVNLFGSWCPNCNDEAPVLADWYRRYHDRGLEIVGLAFEATGDATRDRRFVRTYEKRHGIEFPVALAGVADKAKAAAKLPDLDRVAAFPTTVFIARDGRVRRIYSGFEGPGTGEHFHRTVGELERLIERLLDEPAPPSSI